LGEVAKVAMKYLTRTTFALMAGGRDDSMLSEVDLAMEVLLRFFQFQAKAQKALVETRAFPGAWSPT
jgi:hypothetical protein